MRILKISHLIRVLLISAFLTASLMAGDKEDLTQVMKNKVLIITKILKDKKLLKDQKNAKIENATNNLFDYNLMGRLSLGKKEWSELDNNKKKEYTTLFERRIKDSYMDKLHLYTDEKVIVEDALQIKISRIQVPSYIIAKDGKTEMIYKFHRAKEGVWLIYDVEIAGVSIVQTYRSQFSEILKTKTVDELIEKMKSLEQL